MTEENKNLDPAQAVEAEQTPPSTEPNQVEPSLEQQIEQLKAELSESK
ncbi:MAG: hypothetical protein RIR83_440, partial [Pseudomonadota bacterium]